MPSTTFVSITSHAIFHFVDNGNQPLQQITAQFQLSTGERQEATTHDFGEFYLDATETGLDADSVAVA